MRAVVGCYLRSSFLGRTTQRANSPIKAPAAAMAIIWAFLRTRYEHSICPGYYTPFSWMLNVCYTSNRSRVRAGAESSLEKPSPRAGPSAGRQGRPISARRLFVLEELPRKNNPGNEQQDKSHGSRNRNHPGHSSCQAVARIAYRPVAGL